MLKRDKFSRNFTGSFQAVGTNFGTDGSVLLVSDTVPYARRTGNSPAQFRKPETWRIFTIFDEINAGIRRFVRAWKVYLRTCGLKE